MQKTHCCFHAALCLGLVALSCETQTDSNHSTQTAGGAAGSFSNSGAMGGVAGRLGLEGLGEAGRPTSSHNPAHAADGGAESTTAISGATGNGGNPNMGGASVSSGTTNGGTTKVGNPGGAGEAVSAGTKSGGASSKGGASSGGASSKGGASIAAGTTGLGGSWHSAGSKAIGGATNGGVPPTTGGKATSGGVSNGGAANPTCVPGTPKSGGTEYCAISKGDAGDGYSYDIWTTTAGPACMTVYGSDATFKTTWSGVADVLARVGLRLDKTKTYDQLGTISSDFAFTKTGSGGAAYIGIYGVTVDPSHEYYIVEDWIGSRPVPGENVGTISVDGGLYDVYENTPTSAGTPIVQFFSVRQTARQCGHVSASQHFSEWARLGLTLGKLESVDLVVEAMRNGSGTVDFTTGILRVD